MSTPDRSSTATRRRADSGGKLEDITGNGQEPLAPAEAPVFALPDAKTSARTGLEEKVIYLYGAEGIGKSTLAAELDWLFFDTENGLTELEVFRAPVDEWHDFRLGVAEAKKHPGKYGGYVIDTYDQLVVKCRAHVLEKLGIQHESNLEWGAGWDAVKTELGLWVNRLAGLPGGLLVLGHDVQETIKLRGQEITKFTPAVNRSAREIVTKMADIVLLGDYEETDEGERRVFRTKPSRYWVAKDRTGRLPEAIDWPLGSGWDALKAAWDSGSPTTKG